MAQCDCKAAGLLSNTSPQIAAAYEKFVAARTELLIACDHGRQLEIARLDESAWYSFEDEILRKIECLSDALEKLARIRSKTINDLALKLTATNRNVYVTEAIKREIEKDLAEITGVSPACVEVDAVRLKRPEFL